MEKKKAKKKFTSKDIEKILKDNFESFVFAGYENDDVRTMGTGKPDRLIRLALYVSYGVGENALVKNCKDLTK